MTTSVGRRVPYVRGDGTPPPTKSNHFQTSDGYTFRFHEGAWVDNVDPDNRDMTFAGDADGPIDEAGFRVEGNFFLPVLQVPDPRLYEVAAEVADLSAPEVIQAIIDLRATARTISSGGALAAPQIGIPLRIVLIEKKVLGFEILINPRFQPKKGTPVVVGPEACYSVDNAGRTIQVSRHDEGRVYASLPDGRRIKKHARGFPARMIQHEIGHLDGVTIDALL